MKCLEQEDLGNTLRFGRERLHPHQIMYLINVLPFGILLSQGEMFSASPVGKKIKKAPRTVAMCRGTRQNSLDTMKVGCYIEKEAGIAQLVEYKLPKLGVAGSNPVARSTG